jgi:hypothetical protein
MAVKDQGESEREMTEAATRLGEALAAYQRAARRFLGQTLETRGHVARAAEQLGEVATLDDQLSTQVAALVGAVSQARERQQRVAEEVHQRALELLARKEELEPLVARQQELTAEVATVGELIARDAADPGGALAVAMARIQELVAAARALAQETRAHGFTDMAEDVLALADRLAAIEREAARRRDRGRRDPPS